MNDVMKVAQQMVKAEKEDEFNFPSEEERNAETRKQRTNETSDSKQLEMERREPLQELSAQSKNGGSSRQTRTEIRMERSEFDNTVSTKRFVIILTDAEPELIQSRLSELKSVEFVQVVGSIVLE